MHPLHRVDFGRFEISGQSNSKCVSFHFVISLFFYRTVCMYANLSLIQKTSDVTMAGGETVTTGCGELKPD